MKHLKQILTILGEKRNRPLNRLMAVILVAVLTVLIVGVTSAWYDTVRETETVNLSLKSESQLVSIEEIKLYTSSGVRDDTTESFTLKSFDSVFGRNSDTPMYILIAISGEAVQNTGYELIFKFDCGDTPLVNNGTIQPYFSNVAQLRCVTVDAAPGSYWAAQAEFPANTNTQRFASFEVDKDTHALNSGYLKNSSVELSVPGHSDTGVKYVLFELDYNFELVTSFVDNYSSGITGRLDESQTLDFDECETFQITVGVQENTTA